MTLPPDSSVWTVRFLEKRMNYFLRYAPGIKRLYDDYVKSLEKNDMER